jgi:hypothetical protein
MDINKDIPIVNAFFESTAVKDIFDNLRNLLICGAIAATGVYINNEVASGSTIPIIFSCLGWGLIVLSFVLTCISLLHGYFLLKKNVISKTWFAGYVITGIYFAFGILVVLRFYWQKGIK